MNYTPDNWVILHMKGDEGESHKVLAGWSGSYLHGASWKLNSGITRVVDEGDYWNIHGYSGSSYLCRKNRERLGSITAVVLASFEEVVKDTGASVRVVPVADILEEYGPGEEVPSP